MKCQQCCQNFPKRILRPRGRVSFACAASLSFGWSEQSGPSLSIQKAEAATTRLYVGPLYHGGYIADATGLPWYAVRAYYAGGPWYTYSGWADYAARNGIGCVPGTLVKGGDGIMYVCQ